MLNTTLATLKTLLKAEIGNELSVVTSQDAALESLLLMGQRDLADQFDWPHLKLALNVGVDAQDQYITLPTQLNFDRPVRVAVQDGDVWLPVGYGIDEPEYNAYDFADGDTSTPIMKWQRSGATEFEVWPVGGTGQVLRFIGQRRMDDLSATTPAFLDDLLLIYYVAAEYLTRLKNAQASLELSKLNARMSQLRRSAPTRSGISVMGGRVPHFVTSRRIFTIAGPAVASGTTPEGDSSPFFGSDSQNFGTNETVFGT